MSVLMTCCKTRYATVMESMDHECPDDAMVRTVMTTDNGKEPMAPVITQPMTRFKAIAEMNRIFKLDQDKWADNVQTITMGKTTWTFTIIAA